MRRKTQAGGVRSARKRAASRVISKNPCPAVSIERTAVKIVSTRTLQTAGGPESKA